MLAPGRISVGVVIAASVGGALVGGCKEGGVIGQVGLPGVPSGQGVVRQATVAGSIPCLRKGFDHQ